MIQPQICTVNIQIHKFLQICLFLIFRKSFTKVIKCLYIIIEYFVETLNQTFAHLLNLFFHSADSRQTRTKIPQTKIAIMKQQQQTKIAVMKEQQSYFINKNKMSPIFQNKPQLQYTYSVSHNSIPSVCSCVVKWPQEKWECHSHDDATPLSFQFQVTEDFF